jgi:hypothetical protein
MNFRKGTNILSTQMWLAMAESGGWWTARELRDRFATDKKGINLITWTLRAMVARKELARQDATHPKFAVMPDSIVPRGVTAKQLLNAMGATA